MFYLKWSKPNLTKQTRPDLIYNWNLIKSIARLIFNKYRNIDIFNKQYYTVYRYYNVLCYISKYYV